MKLDLLQIAKHIDIYHNAYPAPSQDLFLKYLPLLSPLIVIATFFFNNWYNVRTKRKETRRNWYFKAYFEPALKKVEEFFSEADKDINNALDAYESSSEWSEEYRIKFVAEILAKLANAKRKFSIEVLSVLRPAYPSEFCKLEGILNNFEDAGSEAFTNPPDKDAYFTYIFKINSIKAELIKTLSAPALI